MTEPKPIISVIIPHLNQPDHLDRCLRSLRAQSFDMSLAEILVVDNGSREVPDGLCRAFPSVRLERELTPGPGPARNLGIKAAQSDILAFIDADCIADREWLAAIWSALRADGGFQIIGGDVRIALANPTKLTAIEAYECIFAYRQKEYIERHGFSGTGNLAFRRAAYDSVGPFAGIEIAEDRDWGRRASAAGYTIGYLSDMVVFHPARKTILELYEKWDRHIHHDFEEQVHGAADRLRWFGLAMAVAVSPAMEIRRIVSSCRISNWRERRLAAQVLTRLRLYRAKRMLQMMLRPSGKNAHPLWNVK